MDNLFEEKVELIAQKTVTQIFEQLNLDEMNKVWLTVKDVCKYLSMGSTKVRELIKDNVIPVHWIGGSIRILKSELDQSIIQHRHTQSSNKETI